MLGSELAYRHYLAVGCPRDYRGARGLKRARYALGRAVTAESGHGWKFVQVGYCTKTICTLFALASVVLQGLYDEGRHVGAPVERLDSAAPSEGRKGSGS